LYKSGVWFWYKKQNIPEIEVNHNGKEYGVRMHAVKLDKKDQLRDIRIDGTLNLGSKGHTCVFRGIKFLESSRNNIKVMSQPFILLGKLLVLLKG
jgi:hypothetical protein